jgi:hypothetical protein
MRSRLKADLLADELPKLLGGLHGLQTAIEADRRLDITVAKKPADRFIVAGTVLQINGCGSMPELMEQAAKYSLSDMDF